MKNKVQAYHRLSNYIAVAQIYLKDNFFLERPLQFSDIKDRLLGHWWTVPGLNLAYACLNELICKQKLNMIFVTGPWHWFPAIQANLFIEGSLSNMYPKQIPYNIKWLSSVIKYFSWPYWYPSHLNPWAPWCILEWWELWYSLSTSFWAVLDNPKLIVACVIWDWESETATINWAWQSIKFINPITSWAVLPIVHLNWYKISGPTVFSMMTNADIKSYFKWMWYKAIIVEWNDLYSSMRKAVTSAYKLITTNQHKARKSNKVDPSAVWPVIVMKTPKWWTTIPSFDWSKLEWNCASHQVVLKNCKTSEQELKLLETWLKSYKVEELLDSNGQPTEAIKSIIPTSQFKMWLSKYANWWVITSLNKPNINHILPDESPMKTAWKYLKELFVLNKESGNFRLFSPDETYSNKLDAVFEVTQRAYMYPPKPWEKDLSTNWRVMEILSEHALQWWLEWYLLTWRHGIFTSYEAFIQVVASMVDQYAKFIHQSKEIPWRKPIASLNYLLTSLWWRQDHNWYSHQNPWFVSWLLNKHWDYISVYYPVDSNSMLVCLDEIMSETNNINVIVAWKNNLPQYLTLKEAKSQLRVWAWVWHSISNNYPEIVLSSCWDYVTSEMMEAIKILRTFLPEIRLQYTNVTKITASWIWTEKQTLDSKQFNEMFTSDKPVIFSYSWYPQDIKKVLFGASHSERFTINGYQEEWSTTTPLDMMIRNWCSRYQICIQVCKLLSKPKSFINKLVDKLNKHREYIIEHWVDPDNLNAI